MKLFSFITNLRKQTKIRKKIRRKYFCFFNASTLAVETWLLQKKNTRYLAIKQQCTAKRSDIFYVKCPFA